MTEARAKLLQVLTTVQNSRAFRNQDIMTFAGFMADDELPEYIASRAKQLSTADQIRVAAHARRLNGEG